MNWIHPTSLLIGAWLLAFFQSWSTTLRSVVGAQPEFLASLMVYSALYSSLPTTLGVALVGGLGLDSLSSGPFGLGAVPLLLLGVLLHRRKDVILRDSSWAQASIGGVAAFGVAMGSFLLLFVLWPLLQSGPGYVAFWPETRSGLSELPDASFGRLWQWFFAGLAGAGGTPIVFAVYRWIDVTCNYQSAPVPVRRGDREIDRGRS